MKTWKSESNITDYVFQWSSVDVFYNNSLHFDQRQQPFSKNNKEEMRLSLKTEICIHP